MPTAQIIGVIHQRQLNPRACWYTCLQMAVTYYENQGAGQSCHFAFARHFSEYAKTIFADGSNPSWAEWRSWTEQCGFTPLNLSANADGIYQFLSTYGLVPFTPELGEIRLTGML